MAPSIYWLLLCAIPLGLGAGSVDAALNHYVATHYKAHHMSWLHCFWGIGATTGPMIMAAFLSRNASWRGGYQAVAGIQFTLVIVLAFTLWLWERPTAAAPANVEPPAGAGGTDKASGVAYALAAFLFYCGVEATVGLWGSSYLVNGKGLLAGDAARWVSIYYGGITIGRLVTGFITFEVSNRLLIRSGQLTALAGALLLLLPLPTGLALAGFLITGLGLAPLFPCMLHETPERFGAADAAVAAAPARAVGGVLDHPHLLALCRHGGGRHAAAHGTAEPPSGLEPHHPLQPARGGFSCRTFLRIYSAVRRSSHR